jgi:hypothetical protein
MATDQPKQPPLFFIFYNWPQVAHKLVVIPHKPHTFPSPQPLDLPSEEEGKNRKSRGRKKTKNRSKKEERTGKFACVFLVLQITTDEESKKGGSHSRSTQSPSRAASGCRAWRGRATTVLVV